MSYKRMSRFLVSFVPLQSVENVDPPFVAGKRDSTWVNALNKEDAITAAKNKMMGCYDIDIADVVVCD